MGLGLFSVMDMLLLLLFLSGFESMADKSRFALLLFHLLTRSPISLAQDEPWA